MNKLASVQNALNGSLGENLFVSRFVFKNNTHAFDIRVKRELCQLLPSRLRAGGPSRIIPVEARCENLHSDFGRVAPSMPLAVVITHVNFGEVGKGCDIEEIFQVLVVVDEFFGRNRFLTRHGRFAHFAWW